MCDPAVTSRSIPWERIAYVAASISIIKLGGIAFMSSPETHYVLSPSSPLIGC